MSEQSKAEDGRGSAADVRALGGVGGHVGAPQLTDRYDPAVTEAKWYSV